MFKSDVLSELEQFPPCDIAFQKHLHPQSELNGSEEVR
jgi:hypothetical protein